MGPSTWRDHNRSTAKPVRDRGFVLGNAELHTDTALCLLANILLSLARKPRNIGNIGNQLPIVQNHPLTWSFGPHPFIPAVFLSGECTALSLAAPSTAKAADWTFSMSILVSALIYFQRPQFDWNWSKWSSELNILFRGLLWKAPLRSFALRIFVWLFLLIFARSCLHRSSQALSLETKHDETWIAMGIIPGKWVDCRLVLHADHIEVAMLPSVKHVGTIDAHW